MWTISKRFEFDYGHRVWAQQLSLEASGMTENKCRHLHGHRGVIEITLTANELDKKGMVTDFNNLNWFKRYIDETIDHKTILDIEDPITKILVPMEKDMTYLHEQLAVYPFAQVLSSQNYLKTPEGEFEHSFVFIKGIPTSEVLCQLFAKAIESKMKTIADISKVKLQKVTFWETPKSKSTYEPAR